MAVSRAMRRLLDVLEIQEEECRAALEAARAELTQLERALNRSAERERSGRRLVAASATSGEVADRIAGTEETRIARRISKALRPRMADSKSAVDARQQEFLTKRIERRQTQTLIEEAEALERIEAGRRAQRDLDDWFLSSRVLSGEARSHEMLENPNPPVGGASQRTRKT